MDTTTIAVDLAKDVFEVAIVPASSREIAHRRLSRRQFTALVDTLPAGATIVMEACGTAHYWGRRCQARGATVRLLPAQYVRPYVRRNKTDRADVEALLEAHRCRTLDPVPVKTTEQQALQGVHRVRAQWQTTRTARINLIRALCREHGVLLPSGAGRVRAHASALLADDHVPLPPLLRLALTRLVEDLAAVEQHIAAVDRQLAAVARQEPIARRLQEIPGVGVLTATALLGSVAHMQRFRRARQFASWVGLTPRESSSGHRRTLGRISKRGDVYLRCLLTHGSRAVLRAALRRPAPRLTRFEQWAVALAERRGKNRATIAIANKLARFVWAVWTRDAAFQPTRPVG